MSEENSETNDLPKPGPQKEPASNEVPVERKPRRDLPGPKYLTALGSQPIGDLGEVDNETGSETGVKEEDDSI